MSERQIFTKCAWRLIPFMGLLFLANYIDRVNVGFGALTMNRDLGFSPSVYGLGAGVFFLGYLLFQVPAVVFLARVGARKAVFCIMATWGTISTANALVQSPSSFYALRFFLGVAEAGFIPGMLLYLTYWFPQAYRARYTAMFMSAIPLAFVIGGPLSGLILGMDGWADIHGWQWLFLIEGTPVLLLAFAVLKLLPDGPADASWLTGEEKATIAGRLAAEYSSESRDLRRALCDPCVIALGLAKLGLLVALYGVQLWLPQIVQAMGFSNSATGFVVALTFALSIPAMVLWARSSDVRGERFWHGALSMLLAAAGFIVASLAQNDLLVLVALTLSAVGVLAAVSPMDNLPSSFLSGPALAGGIALYNSIGNVGGFLGPTIIGVLKDATGTYAAGMMALALGLVMSAIIVVALGRAMAWRPTFAANAKVS
jgi:ACS family tartrate transporter-like MFS transporter